jgi:hypothetical protein
MKPQIIIPSAIFVSFVAAAAFWPRSKNGTPVEPPPPKASGVAESTAPEKAVHEGYRWVAGDAGTWSFHTRMAVAPPDSEFSGGLELEGLLHLRVLSAGPEHVEAAVALTDVRSLRDGQRENIVDRMLENTPCLLLLHPDGRVLETRFAAEVPEADRQMVRLVCGWEFVIRAKARWTVQELAEEDQGGHFASTYRWLENGRVEKTRTFSALAGAAGGQRVLFSQFTAKPGSLWLDEMEGKETTELMMDGKPIAQSLVTIRMSRMDDTVPVSPLLASAFPSSPEALATAYTAVPGRKLRESVNDALKRRVLAGRWGSVPVSDIIAALAAVEGKSMQDKLQALHAAQEWLTVHGPAEIVDSLRSGLSQDESGLLIHALGGAGHRDALSELLESPDKLTPAALMQAIVESGAVASPDDRLVKALSNLTSMEVISGAEEDYRPNDAAWYSLGRLAEHSPELRSKLESTLYPELHDADPVFTEVALRTLANARTAAPDVLAFVADRASDPTADVSSRIAALEVLARTTQITPGSTAALAAVLSDSQAELQLAALDAVSSQQTAVQDAAIAARIQTLLASPNDSVAAKAKVLVGK